MHTLSTITDVPFTFVIIESQVLSKNILSVGQMHIDIPHTNLLKYGDLTFDIGNISSIVYSATKPHNLDGLIDKLINDSVHCLFVWLWCSSSSLTDFRFLVFSVVNGTSSVILCTVFKCFLRFVVVLRALESVLLLGAPNSYVFVTFLHHSKVVPKSPLVEHCFLYLLHTCTAIAIIRVL